ncbi:MAG: Kazal-type serine protease inhibitor [Cyclobacteriaceae bacterium]
MKLIPILFIVFTITAYGQESPMPIRPLDTLTINEAAFIGLVKMNEIGDNMIIGGIIHSFKINKMLDEQVVFLLENGRLAFNSDDVYLVFAKDQPGKRFSIDKRSRILKQDDSEKDIAYLLSLLPCFDPDLKELDEGCAHRGGWFVCGCDSNTYSSPCEALKNGIVIFQKGKCK